MSNAGGSVSPAWRNGWAPVLWATSTPRVRRSRASTNGPAPSPRVLNALSASSSISAPCGTSAPANCSQPSRIVECWREALLWYATREVCRCVPPLPSVPACGSTSSSPMAASVPWPATRGSRPKLHRHRRFARAAAGRGAAAKGREACSDLLFAVRLGLSCLDAAQFAVQFLYGRFKRGNLGAGSGKAVIGGVQPVFGLAGELGQFLLKKIDIRL